MDSTIGMSLMDVREAVAAATKDCWDEESTVGDIATRYFGGHNIIGGKMTDIARLEFLSKVGVPISHHGKPFFGRLNPDTQRNVVRDCVIAENMFNKPILARWNGTTLRAVVSNYYTCVPHLSVVQALIESPTPFEVQGFWPYNFTAEAKTMHLRLTTPTIHSLDGDGDIGHTMIHVSNSEVGRGALVLDVGIFRVVCTNGLIARIGGKLLLKERHIYKDPAELLDSFGDAVAQAEEVAAEFMGILDRARMQRAPIDRALALLPSNIMREMVVEAMEGDTLYDLYNAVTDIAQNYSHEAQFTWERWARCLLDMDWSHVHKGEEFCSECGHVLS